MERSGATAYARDVFSGEDIASVASPWTERGGTFPPALDRSISCGSIDRVSMFRLICQTASNLRAIAFPLIKSPDLIVYLSQGVRERILNFHLLITDLSCAPMRASMSRLICQVASNLGRSMPSRLQARWHAIDVSVSTNVCDDFDAFKSVWKVVVALTCIFKTLRL